MNMVEWKEIGEIAKRNKGIPITAGQMSELDAPDGNIRVFAAGQTVANINESELPSNCAYKEPSIIVKSRGYVDFVFYDKPFTHKNEMWSYSFVNKQFGKYVYYFLTTKTEFFRKKAKANSVKLPQLCVADTDKFLIPIPSQSEQNKIVDILDTFTSSIENLKEQIAQRRKQYEYYRDQLLDLEGKEGVERYILKDVCEVINGRAYSQPELLSEGKYRVLRVGNFFSNDSWYYSDLDLDEKYYCEKGDLLYAWSASFGPHIWVGEKTIYHYHIWKMNCSDNIDKMFMYYWLQSEDMRKQAFSNLHGATMAHLTKSLMESLIVPVPPLQEQQRIVSILDTFEASIQNLEAQLSQREKQYEYYRNKLLTFE